MTLKVKTLAMFMYMFIVYLESGVISFGEIIYFYWIM